VLRVAQNYLLGWLRGELAIFAWLSLPLYSFWTNTARRVGRRH
jgi:hypothetical protein